MVTGPNWFSWFTFPVFLPLSGAVNQEISPVYRGVPEIEADVVREVASFGSQLGTISDAVLEIAGRLEAGAADSGSHDLSASFAEAGPDVIKLKTLAKRIEEVKQRHRDVLRRDAEAALDRLRTVDRSAYDDVMGIRRV